jgi:hypothetical protein
VTQVAPAGAPETELSLFDDRPRGHNTLGTEDASPTGDAVARGRTGCFVAGMDHYPAKPFPREALYTALVRLRRFA